MVFPKRQKVYLLESSSAVRPQAQDIFHKFQSLKKSDSKEIILSLLLVTLQSESNKPILST